MCVYIFLADPVYSTFKGYQQFYKQDASVLDSHSIQLVVLPDNGSVRPEIAVGG